MKHIIIIGNGVAGATLARNIRKRENYKITLISDESPYFFSRTAMMYVFMGQMKFEHLQPYENHFWDKNRIELLQARVLSLDTQNKKIELDSKAIMTYDKLIIATGSKPRSSPWEGSENISGLTCFYHKQDLEKLEEMASSISHGVIIGGGLIGIELAEMLISRGKRVTFIVKEASYWSRVLPLEESSLINDEIKKHGVVLKLSSEVKKLSSSDSKRVNSVELTSGEVISCDYVGVAIGVIPNIDFLQKSGVKSNRGIIVDQFLRTNVSDVYAIGDCAELSHPSKNRSAIEPVWYTARKMGEVLASTICGEEQKYEQGHWYNSAKFFDIEYQTYGVVSSIENENESHFYWKAQKESKTIRISYDRSTSRVLGIIALGIRVRQQKFEFCLENSKDLHFVITHFRDICFDPEFYTNYHEDIIKCYNNAFNKNIVLPQQSRYRKFLSYFRRKQ